jgi:hypothetical protein
MKDPNAETVGSLEKKFGFPPGTFRNPNGRDTRSDKLIATIRKEWRRRLRQAQKRKHALLPMTRDLFSAVELAQAS